MLSDVDETLISLVRGMITPGTSVGLTEPERAKSAVTLGLRSIREDLTARDSVWRDHLDDRGRVVARQEPLRRFRFHYLVTAAGPDVTAAHRILGAVLSGLAAHTTVPAEHLAGSLRDAGQPVGIELAHPDCPLPGCHPGAPPDGGLDVVLIACWVPVPNADLVPAPNTLVVDTRNGAPHPTAERREPHRPRGVITEH